MYDVQEVAITELDLAEVVLYFDAPIAIRYFSWEQAGDVFELSVRNKPHLIEEPRPEIQAKDDSLLFRLLGKRHTLFELYADEFGSAVAALLHFESENFAVAVGYDERNVEQQKSEFRFFSGDDLFLWTSEEFIDTLRKHNLKIMSRLEAESFV